MLKALVRKEIRLLVSSSAVAVALDLILPGAALAFVMSAARSKVLSSAPAGVDPFTLFSLFAFGLSSMFLSLTGPVALLERSTGILDSQLALVKTPRPILAAKVIVLVGLAAVSFLFWTAAGVIWAAWTGEQFVESGAWVRAALVTLVVFPASVGLLSSLHVLVGTVYPKIAPLANLVLFAVTFVVFSNLASLTTSVTTAATIDHLSMLAAEGGAIAAVFWLMGIVPKERLIGL